MSRHPFQFIPSLFFTGEQAWFGNKAWTKKSLTAKTVRPMSPASRARKLLVLWGLLAFPMLLQSQTNGLQGNEFPVSGALRGDQMFPSIAFSASGGFVVWQDNITDPSGLGVSARRINAAGVPEGSVIHVNQTLGNDQDRPRVFMLNDGGAAIVYQSGKPGAQNVYARLLTSAGGFATDELIINNPAINVVNRFTTNWVLIRNNRPRNQRYKIKETIKARQEFNANPTVVVLNDGSLVVAYASSRVYTTNTFTLQETLRWNDTKSIFITNRVRVPLNVVRETMQDVYVQRLSAAGQKLGDEFRANQFLDFNQRDQTLAALENGNFVVAWVSERQRSQTVDFAGAMGVGVNSVDVYARIFNALGQPIGNEFLVTATNRMCGSPTVAGVHGGGFTIAWTERMDVRSNSLDVVARVFDAAGGAAGDAFLVNGFRYGDQYAPSMANLGSQQLVVWTSMGQDGSWEGTFARAFNGATALGDEFRVNTSTRGSQMHGRVASDGAGRGIIVWSGYTGTSAFDLFGRSYVAP